MHEGFEEGKGRRFYRCLTCQGVVSEWDIEKGGCPNCKGTRLTPKNLTIMEKIGQIIKHPKVWRW